MVVGAPRSYRALRASAKISSLYRFWLVLEPFGDSIASIPLDSSGRASP